MLTLFLSLILNFFLYSDGRGPLLIAHAADSMQAPEPEFVFKKDKIKLGKKVVEVEIADTAELTARGLMFRESLEKDKGMLFIFDKEGPLSFWMKNTFIDLDIAYFDKNKKLIDIQSMKATSKAQLQFPSYPSRGPAQYALEMNLGWFARNHISKGAHFEFLSRRQKSRDK